MKTVPGLPRKVKQDIIEEDEGCITISLKDHWRIGFSRIKNSLFIDKTLTSNQIRLLGIMLGFANYPGADTTPKPVSISYLRKLSGLSRVTVTKAIEKLKKLGHIKEVIAPGPEQCRCIIVPSVYLHREGYENSQPGAYINAQDPLPEKSDQVAQNAQGVVQKIDQGVAQKISPKELTIKKTNLCAQVGQVLEKYKLAKSAYRREITEFNKLKRTGLHTEEQILRAVKDLFEHGVLKDGEKCDKPMTYLACGPSILQKVLDRIDKRENPGSFTISKKKIFETIHAAGSGENRFNSSFNDLNSYEKQFIENMSKARRLGPQQIYETEKAIKDFAFNKGVELVS